MKKIVVAKKAWLILGLSFFLSPLFAEGYLSLGTAGGVELDDPYPFTPDLRLFLGFDSFSPLSDEWSIFLSGGALGFLRPLDPDMRYLYSSSFAASYRSGDFFFKAGLSAKGEQLYFSTLSKPDTFDNSLELQFSYDIAAGTLFFIPSLSYSREEHVLDNVLLHGKLGFTFLPDERLITTLALSGDLTLVPLHYSEYSGRLEVNLSYYPDLPLIMTLTLGAVVNASDYEEPVVGVPVKRLDDWQFIIGADINASLAEWLILRVFVPAKFSLKSMNAVQGGVFTDEREWTLVIAPEVEFSFLAGKGHTISCRLKGEPYFSNSDYYDHGYIEFLITYRYVF